jgi:hypothetical protein
MNRRQFTLFALASAFTGAASASSGGKALKNIIESEDNTDLKNHSKSQSTDVFGAYDDENGQHFVACLNLIDNKLSGEKLDSLQIPFRAHDTIPLSKGRSLSFARRPHNQMIISDFATKEQRIINANEGRHFYGHGCIDISRNTLFATENDYDNARGVISLRDAHNFKQLGEYESCGIGPHDIHLMPDNKTLVVANGGIETHPDFGRRKLNIKTMQPSLTFIDIDSGKKIDEYRLSNHKLSIRHLMVTADGGVAVGTQYQGQPIDGTPDYLLAWIDKNTDGLQTFDNNRQFTKDCRGYIADVAVDTHAQIMAATSPRGNNVSFWSIPNRTLLKTIEISGPSGLCFNSKDQEFLVSNDKGNVFKIPLHSNQFIATQLQAFPVKWDNHLYISV